LALAAKKNARLTKSLASIEETDSNSLTHATTSFPGTRIGGAY